MIKPKFDELIHAPTRLSLVSLLAATEWADFKFLRDSAGLSDSALSKQLTTLEDAGYIEIHKVSSESGRARRRSSPASAGRPSTSTLRPCRRSSPTQVRRCSPRPKGRKEGFLLTRPLQGRALGKRHHDWPQTRRDPITQNGGKQGWSDLERVKFLMGLQ